MFCLAIRSDLQQIEKVTANDATLRKNAISIWSQNTHELAMKVLAVLEHEYIPHCNKTELNVDVLKSKTIKITCIQILRLLFIQQNLRFTTTCAPNQPKAILASEMQRQT